MSLDEARTETPEDVIRSLGEALGAGGGFSKGMTTDPFFDPRCDARKTFGARTGTNAK